jgi:hypothetical protein
VTQNIAKVDILQISIQCDSSIFEKVFIWFLGQPVVWSEPNVSQIEAWSSILPLLFEIQKASI